METAAEQSPFFLIAFIMRGKYNGFIIIVQLCIVLWVIVFLLE